MSDKQTQCPECSTVYKVTLPQLTVAQGMVCCPKCDVNFNALSHLVDTSSPQDDLIHEQDAFQFTTHHKAIKSFSFSNQNILDIFDRKLSDSDITFQSYLNSLKQGHSDGFKQFPDLNLSEGHVKVFDPNDHKRSLFYYATWGIINLLLISILTFQILWFNPEFLDKSPTLKSFFNHACQLTGCETLEQRYTKIKIEKVKMRHLSTQESQFSGSLTNTHEKNLQLPILSVTLLNNQKVVEHYELAPQDYLTQSFQKIERIPKDTTFKFKFNIEKGRKDFNDYRLEIIHP